MALLKNEITTESVFLYTLYAIAFTIPVYGRLIPLLILVLGITWLVRGRYVQNFRLIFKEKKRFLVFSLSFIYLFYLVGMLWTDNLEYGWFDLEVKFSLLLFPLIFSMSGLPLVSKQETATIFKFFIAGCIAGSLLLVGHAFYCSAVLHLPDSFYYSKLAWASHPSYYSMYLAFAASNMLYFLLIRRETIKKTETAAYVTALVFFTVMIVLLSSKAGLLIWGAVITFYTFLLLVIVKNRLKGVLFFSIALVLLLLALQLFPNVANRVSQAKRDVSSADTVGNSKRSTGERIMIWNASLGVVRDNFFFGAGTGDVKDKLMEGYAQTNSLAVLKEHRNAHNQFVQTWIALGVLGFLLFASMLVIPAIISCRMRFYPYFAFLFIMAISLFFESMFETQAGVVFFAFFNTIMFGDLLFSSPEPAVS
ncbi:MAG: O-antigen ligase family protein [Bacteroidetes bacterium]|nr:O-antigen ligase family protein [Bacteroidota bacterium]